MGVRRVRRLAVPAPHPLRIAMIGGDEERATGGLHGAREAAEAAVNGGDGRHRRVEVARVAHHVGVGVVDDDEVEAAAPDCLDHAVGHRRCRHLGLQVIGRDLGRGDEHAFLARHLALLAAVEEERHVGVLLGLGDAELAQPCVGDERAEAVRHLLRGEHRPGQAVQALGIAAHADGGGEAHAPLAPKAVEDGVEQRRHDLAGAVGPEIAHDQPVAVRHPRVAGDHCWLDELVARVACVALGDGRLGARRRPSARGDQGVVGLRGPLPAPVAVHGVVAAGNSRDLHAGQNAKPVLEVREILDGRTWRHVAAVEEGVDHDGHARVAYDPSGLQDVVLVRMNTAGRDEAHQVAAAPALLAASR